MQIMNWVEVEPAGNGVSKLPAGAYVLRITDVSDHTSRNGNEYVTFVYDVAEGEHANHFAGDTREYTHRFDRYYTGKSQGFFRTMLDMFQACNPGKFDLAQWSMRNLNAGKYDWQALKGLTIGVLFRDRIYTNSQGRDVTVLDYVRPMTADEVRAGKWTVPPVKDERDGGGSRQQPQPMGMSSGDVYNADIPF